MPRRHPDNTDAGQDSFLDIVANIVGILIILVMVVGVRAKDAFVAEKRRSQSEEMAAPTGAVDPARRQQLEESRRAVKELKSEVEDLAATTASVEQTLKVRFRERGQLQQLAVAAEKLIEEERSDAGDDEGFRLRRELQAARDELEDLTTAQIAVENSAAPVEVLRHMPTPMAKTVFGDEAHFRLQGGRVVYVPLTELVEQMKKQAELKVYKLEDASQITEVIGPLNNFSMKYTLRRRKMALNTSRGTMIREVADLDSFVLVPARANLGEPVAQALQENSAFREHLRRLDPDRTTITVWTYPDSFEDFRQLKDELYKMGYLTAGRPMPEGHPIGGSPRGTRSAAQ